MTKTSTRSENSSKYQDDSKIFEPINGVILKKDYPELADNKKFKELSSEELTWVWHFACKSSDIANDDSITINQRQPKPPRKHLEAARDHPKKTGLSMPLWRFQSA